MNDLTQEQNAWQPIETAPKDGTRILVCGGTYTVSNDEYPDWPMTFADIVTWQKHRNCWISGPSHDGGDFVHQPTHWMPLPEVPK